MTKLDANTLVVVNRGVVENPEIPIDKIPAVLGAHACRAAFERRPFRRIASSYIGVEGVRGREQHVFAHGPGRRRRGVATSAAGGNDGSQDSQSAERK